MAIDAFIKIDGIEGESPDAKHAKEIQVINFSFGATQPAQASVGGGAGVGKVQVHDLTFTHLYDKASPKLFVASTTGQHIAKAVLSVRKAGGDQQDYLVTTLTDVVVSSVMASGGADGVHTESVALNFTQINHEYKEQKADGSLSGAVTGGFNVKTMKKV